jgi:hypothetical protein
MSIKDRGAKMQKRMTTGNNVNKVITVYGYDEIYNFMTDNHEFVYNGNNEFRFGNTLMIVGDYYLNIRIYDNTNEICVASIVLNYDDFAMRYRARDKDLKLLSRTGDKVSDKMYIHLI